MGSITITSVTRRLAGFDVNWSAINDSGSTASVKLLLSGQVTAQQTFTVPSSPNFAGMFLAVTGTETYTQLLPLATGVYHLQIADYTGAIGADSNIITEVVTMAAPSEPTVTPPSAPTAPEKPFTFNIAYKAPNGHTERLTGSGFSADAAWALVTAKAKVTASNASPVVRTVTETIRYATSVAPTFGTYGPTADAEIVCFRASDDKTIRLTIPDMLLSYRVGSTSFIDVNNADIIAVASAVLDEYGNGGFVPLSTSKYLA